MTHGASATMSSHSSCLSEGSSILHVREGCLREERQVMVLREVIGVLVIEPPWSVLRGERGCLLEIVLLFQPFKFRVFRIELRWEYLVVTQEANLLELSPVGDG